MKHIISLICTFSILLSVFVLTVSCSKTESGTFKIDGVTLKFEESTGLLKQITANGMTIEMEGVIVDLGLDGKPVTEQIISGDIGELATWDLPEVTMRNKGVPEGYACSEIKKEKNTVVVKAKKDNITFTNRYTIENGSVKITSDIASTDDKKHTVSGVAHVVKGFNAGKESTFAFPGNFPIDSYKVSTLQAWKIISTEYCNPVTYFERTDGDVNILFINQVEKWSTGVTRGNDFAAHVYNISATECYLEKDKPITVGDLYIQLSGKNDDFAMVRDLYTANGWVAPSDGVSVGPMYSGHPYGTMDSGFNRRETLQDFAGYLDTLNQIGFKNVWLLPVFQHPGDSVYASIDQTVIDSRYGGEEGVKAYTSKAHQLGMRVLFDYVPHGPEPYRQLVVDNPGWCSTKKDGEKQIEWECVSFDYNNSDYMKYMQQLVKTYAGLGVDGARIDCAMGGLPNWSPVGNNRPSASGLQAGVNISKTIRQGIIDGGLKPVNMPENFHPVPFYASYTDLFYDMPLYRTIFELRETGADDKQFASKLSRWLSFENKVSPKGQVKLRYLSNHDTVDWVWDAKRPILVYGEEKAKALWALLSLIDGVPMVYQGDEDPSIHGKFQEPNLIPFFTELFKAREDNFGESNDYAIDYKLSDSPVITFTRTKDKDKKTVMISLSQEQETCPLAASSEITYGKGAKISGDAITLEPYGFAILKSN